MQTIQQGYRGFALLMNLNWDRLLYVGAIAMALGAASLINAMIG
jgi:hypothetical protein